MMNAHILESHIESFLQDWIAGGSTYVMNITITSSSHDKSVIVSVR